MASDLSISGVNETETLFNLSCPAGSVVDVTLSVRAPDNEAAVTGESGTAAAATAGRVYWNYLDGFAAKTLAPQGGVRTLP